MRKRLWLQFHLWTLGFLALLTIANIVSALRPFHSNPTSDAANGAINLVQSVSSTFDRGPASNEPVVQDPALALKLQQVGCESPLSIRLPEGVRQIRLQFEACAKDKVDTVVSVQNATNNFEATVFGNIVETPKSTDGTFVMAAPEQSEQTLETAPEKAPRAPAAANLSTDYISLAHGANEIKIQRKKRLQLLKIDRE